MVQDKDGYLWIGTAYGLNRYDGYHVRQYPDAKGEVKGIYSLVADQDGNVWIKTGYNNLERYDRSLDKFVSAEKTLIDKGVSSFETYNVFIDNMGKAWYTAEDSIYTYDKSTKKWLGYHVPRAYSINGLLSIDGDDYIAIYNQVLRRDKDENEFVEVEFNNASLSDLLSQNKHIFIDTDDDKALWLYSKEAPGVWFKKAGINEVRELKLPATDFVVSNVVDDHNGNVWIGTNHNGVYVLNKATGQLDNIYQPLSASTTDPFYNISNLYVDRNDNIWAGTYASGLYLRQQPKRKIDTRNMGDDVVSVLYKGKDNTLWVGTDGNGLWKEANGLRQHVVPEARIITALCEDANGTMWIGTFAGGMFAYDGRTVRRFTPDNSGLPENNVYALAEDSEGNIWLGTLGNGLQKYNPKDDTFQRVLPDMHSVSTILYDPESNTIWASGDSGVARINLGTGKEEIITKFGNLDIKGRFVRHIYIDHKNVLWLALNGELVRWPIDTENVKSWRQSDGLPGSMVSAIIEDSNGHIWVAADKGVAELSLLPSGATFKPYTINDGLITNYFTSNKAAVEYPVGTMLFGAEGGYNMISGASTLPQADTRRPMVTDLMVDGHRLDSKYVKHDNDKIEIDIPYGNGPRAKSLKMSFSDFDFAGVGKEVLMYRLRDDEPWLRLDGNQLVTAHLTPGVYDISLMKVDANGYSHDFPAVVQLRISEPWWLSAWALIIYGVLLCALVTWAITAFMSMRTRKMHQQFEAKDSARQAEMDAMKMRFFTNISHDLRTPLQLVLTPLAELKKEGGDNKKIDTAYRNATSMMAILNEMLDIRRLDANDNELKAEKADFVDFLRGQMRTFKVFTDNNDRGLSFESTIDSLPMEFDADKMQRVVYNLLNNAFKYTKKGGQIDVTLTTRDGKLLMRVADDGIGIPDENKPHVFDKFFRGNHEETTLSGAGMGLHLVSEYVKLHGGEIWVEDNRPRGTVFVITMPV